MKIPVSKRKLIKKIFIGSMKHNNFYLTSPEYFDAIDSLVIKTMSSEHILKKLILDTYLILFYKNGKVSVKEG
jgi:hypothetical protein